MNHMWSSASLAPVSGAGFGYWRQRLRIAMVIIGASVLLMTLLNAGYWLRMGIHVGAGFLLPQVYFAGAGALVWLSSGVFDPWLARRVSAFGWRLLLGELVVMGGLAVLTWLVFGLLFPGLLGRPVTTPGLYRISYTTAVVFALVYGWLLFARASVGSQSTAQQLQTDTDRLAASLSRAELAMLQAQIEPHFLFNTLALIKTQYRVDPAQARRVMATLIAFLESAAPALQQDQWTLGQELALVRLYLDILRHRFGTRLTYAVEAPAASLAARLPALVMATLVENAVRHGLAPKAGDGNITIRVQDWSAALHIEISDNGVGLRQHGGSGQGLATVRARLASAFGSHASLLVEANPTGGVRAVVCVPAGASHAA